MPSCFPYKKNSEQLFDETHFVTDKACYFCDRERLCENKRQALAHPLYKVIPRHRCQIYWYDIGHWISWSLFGNDEHGLFGEDHSQAYRLEKEVTFQKALSWWMRNPLHNFCYYVIGTAQFPNSQFILMELHSCGYSFCTYHQQPTPEFKGESSSFFCGLHGWKPFVALRLVYDDHYKGETYVGWRTQGNFGIKLLPYTTRKLEQAVLD